MLTVITACCNCNFLCISYRFYDLEKWETKQREKGKMKAIKKAQKQQVSFESDELQHKSLHSRTGGPGKENCKKESCHNKNYAACSLWYTVVYYGISYVYWQNCKIIVKGQCPTEIFPPLMKSYLQKQ